MIAAEGILTGRGGVSRATRPSSPARWARSASPAAAKCTSTITRGTLTVRRRSCREGDYDQHQRLHRRSLQRARSTTADSELKQVLIAKTMKPDESDIFKYYDFVMKLADKYRKLGLRTNADQPDQVVNAIAFGAEGIGLCRTEHMFFEGDRIDAVREMIPKYQYKKENRRDHRTTARRSSRALAKLLPYQREDFDGNLRGAGTAGPVTIRLLDPPLHEFLPHDNEAAGRTGQGSSASSARSRRAPRARAARVQPDAGLPRLPPRHLAIPEITEMQVPGDLPGRRRGAQKMASRSKPEVMVPLVGFKTRARFAGRDRSSRREGRR